MSHLHILSDTPDELLYQCNQNASLMQGTGTWNNDIEEEEPEESYCDVKGCGRMFPHKHISSENDKDSGQTSSSLLLNETTGRGAEALDKSYLSSL